MWAAPISWSGPHHQSGCESTYLQTWRDRFCLRELLHPLCRYAHFGIPCGTCSRAREIPLGPDAPKPLRSDDFPEGLEDLTTAERRRLDAANQVYAACCRLIICCIINGIRWSLEQPHRSIFWLQKCWKQVLQDCQPIFTSFHACMHGGQRPKQTTLAYATAESAEETGYPFELFGRSRIIADIILQAHQPQPNVWLAHPGKKARALANKQTKKTLTFMPEFHFVEAYSANTSPSFHVVGDKLRQQQEHDGHTLPKYSRILRITQLNKMGGAVRLSSMIQMAHSLIPEAICRGHPSNICGELAPLMLKAIEDNATNQPKKLLWPEPLGWRGGSRGHGSLRRRHCTVPCLHTGGRSWRANAFFCSERSPRRCSTQTRR